MSLKPIPSHTPSPSNDSYGWHLQYLTIIGLSLATLTFLTGLLADTLASPALFSVKNTLSVASAPMELLISILYWTLKLTDEALVLPDWAPRLPLYADLSFHFIPALALTLDLLFFSPPYGIKALPALGLCGAIAIAYWFWIEVCYSHNGFYPYPLFAKLDFGGRVALFAGSAAVMCASTLGLKWLYGKVNGVQMEDEIKKR